MYSQRLNEVVHLIDLKPMGIENFIASYVLKGSKVAIIETGPTVSIENLLAGLREMGIRTEEVDYVAVSHVHVDHAGGAGTLLHHLPNARLLVHARGAPHMVHPAKLWTQAKQVLGDVADVYGEPKPVPEERVMVATDGMVVGLGEEVEVRVLETPGHASHHLSFYEKNGGVFPGDAAGIYLSRFDVVVPTTPMPFHLEMALASLDKLIKTAPRRLYYTHFGQTDDAVKKLRTHATQLKLWARIVLDGMETGKDMAAISERVLEEDPATKAAADVIKGHMMFSRGVIMQNIQGFVEYLRKSSPVDLSSKTHT